MIGVIDRYLALLEQQLLRREMAGGELPEAEEDQFTDDLDACWAQMTSADMAETERRFASSRETEPDAPADLGSEDVLVESGRAPRKAA
jgi:hypothetical protein